MSESPRWVVGAGIALYVLTILGICIVTFVQGH